MCNALCVELICCSFFAVLIMIRHASKTREPTKTSHGGGTCDALAAEAVGMLSRDEKDKIILQMHRKIRQLVRGHRCPKQCIHCGERQATCPHLVCLHNRSSSTACHNEQNTRASFRTTTEPSPMHHATDKIRNRYRCHDGLSEISLAASKLKTSARRLNVCVCIRESGINVAKFPTRAFFGAGGKNFVFVPP